MEVFRSPLFWSVLVVLEGMVVSQAWCAWRSGILTPRQMLTWTREGLPFIAHGGMWGDMLIISPLAAYMIAMHSERWSVLQIIIPLAVGFLGSWLMHQAYNKGIRWPEAHLDLGRNALSEAGRWHLVYMALALAVILLYYSYAPYTSAMWWVTCLLVVHLALGNHIVLNLVGPNWYPGRHLSPQLFRDAMGWMSVVGAGMALCAMTMLRHFKVF